MTSSGQGEHTALQAEFGGTRWTTRQALWVVIGVVLSASLWALTFVTHSATGGWISNLAWTAAATSTLATFGYARHVVDGHRDERRMQRVAMLVQHMNDRQELLASEIQAKQNATAESMLARQQEIADNMTRAWSDLQRAIEGLKKRLGKLIAVQEQREATARVRSSDFDANARALVERMDALALLIETRMPPRQLGYKHRGDSGS